MKLCNQNNSTRRWEKNIKLKVYFFFVQPIRNNINRSLWLPQFCYAQANYFRTISKAYLLYSFYICIETSILELYFQQKHIFVRFADMFWHHTILERSIT